MLAKIFPCQPAEPGFAQLMIRLRGEATVLSNLTFSLCNNEQNYLQPDSSWSSAPHLFTISGGYPFNKGCGFRIGPALLDPLLASASQVQIQVQLASGETRSTTLQLVRDELFSSGARGQTADYSGSSVLDAPAPTPDPVPVIDIEPAPPEPTPPEPTPPEPIRAPVPPRRKNKTHLLLIIAIVLLLIAAGALWWFISRGSATPPAVENKPEAPAIAAAAKTDASACSPVNLAEQNELDFVQNCVQQKLDADKLLAVIQAAKETKHCGVAQRLYATRAQGGDTSVALAYAGEYDPQDHKPSECFKNPDADTAAYWYETVLQTDPDNQKARQRLGELRK